MTQRAAWGADVGYVLTGAPLAEDTNANGAVDQLTVPATISVSSSQVPLTAGLRQALLYWAGTQAQDGAACADGGQDGTVTLTVPGGAATAVDSDTCYCADAAASTYDVWACRADVTSLLLEPGASLTGSYIVDDYAGRVSDASTDTAATALFLAYDDPALPPRRVVLYDGLVTLASASTTLDLGGFDVHSTLAGSLTFFTLEGDIGGSPGEGVNASGAPGGASLDLSDANNPVDDPMNRTINTTDPVQTATIGVDVDHFDIGLALTTADTGLDVTYSAGSDTYWLVANAVVVEQFDPLLTTASSKSWTLQNDADGNGVVTHGDTVRYTVQLVNSGPEDATVDLTDDIPAELSAWTPVDDGGGSDVSTPSQLHVTGLVIPADGGSLDVVFQGSVDDVPDETVITNVASWTAPIEGGEAGSVTAPDVVVRKDGDGDGAFDNDDACPTDAAKTEPGICGCNSPDPPAPGACEPIFTDGFESGDTSAWSATAP